MSSFKKKAARIYKNNVESPKKSGDCKKNLQKILVILQLSAIISEKVKRYQDLNKDIQYRSNKNNKM